MNNALIRPFILSFISWHVSKLLFNEETHWRIFASFSLSYWVSESEKHENKQTFFRQRRLNKFSYTWTGNWHHGFLPRIVFQSKLNLILFNMHLLNNYRNSSPERPTSWIWAVSIGQQLSTIYAQLITMAPKIPYKTTSLAI